MSASSKSTKAAECTNKNSEAEYKTRMTKETRKKEGKKIMLLGSNLFFN
jgi:hypothetical protein